MTATAFFAFLLVFVRCSAMFLSSPVFGAQNIPVGIRVLTTLSVSAALSFLVKHSVTVPATLYDLFAAAAHEAVAGLLLGSFMSLALQGATIAGSYMDMQIGLSMSQIMNPANGISSTIMSQFKFLLSVVVFLSANGHHMLIAAMVRSYDAMPLNDFGVIEKNYIWLITEVFVISIHIAAPVFATGILVDSALGLLNRAVPQMQAVQVGVPAKLALGILAISITLPAVVAGTTTAVNNYVRAITPIVRGHSSG